MVKKILLGITSVILLLWLVSNTLGLIASSSGTVFFARLVFEVLVIAGLYWIWKVRQKGQIKEESE